MKTTNRRGQTGHGGHEDMSNKITESEDHQLHAGADWLRAQGVEVSEFGARVADLLGELYSGIYHLRNVVKFDWSKSDPYPWITILVPDDIYATYDFDYLTELVLLCHERCIRCQVRAARNGILRLVFHPRQREGSMTQRHPTIQQVLAQREEGSMVDEA